MVDGGADYLIARNSRGAGLLLMAIGALGFLGAALWPPLSFPYALALFGVAALVGVWQYFDRRIKLELSPSGFRYAGWGTVKIPWREFSGFRWSSWRSNPYLQLYPRRPDHVLEQFSALGRINHSAGAMVRIPPFSVAVTPLDVAQGDIEYVLSKYLSRTPDRLS